MRLRFSLASLLLLVTVVSIWFAKVAREARVQEAAVKHIELNEGIIGFDYVANVPDWLKRAGGEEYFRSVTSVGFATNNGRKQGSDEPKATDEILIHLKPLADVETLALGNSAAVTDEGLVHLKGLKDLEVLYLYRTGVRGPGLVHVSELPRLWAVDLKNTELCDAGLEHLGRMPRLTWVALDHTMVTDAGMASLAKATALESLTLRNTAITDAGLRQLEQLKRLKWLDIAQTNVSNEGVTHFRNALPKCRLSASSHLAKKPLTERLFAVGYRPTADEINEKLPTMGIDGEVRTDPSERGQPIVQLRIFNSTLSDEVVIALIEEMPQLEMLNVRRGLVGDRLLRDMDGEHLRYLSMQATQVTNDGLRHLARFPNLQDLELSETAVTDEGLVHLEGLTNLKSVRMASTRVSSDGVRRLKQALPNCRVVNR